MNRTLRTWNLQSCHSADGGRTVRNKEINVNNDLIERESEAGSSVTDQGPSDDSGPMHRPTKKERTLSVRVPEQSVQLLMGLSLVDDVTLAETIRRALTSYVESRRQADGFEEQLRAAKERQLALLNQLESS